MRGFGTCWRTANRSRTRIVSKTAESVFEIVRAIPRGSCATYGAVGRAVEPPVSGLVVGKILFRAPSDVPWWRVVGRDGSLLIGRRDPALAVDQASRLELEGVEFADRLIVGRVIRDLDAQDK